MYLKFGTLLLKASPKSDLALSACAFVRAADIAEIKVSFLNPDAAVMLMRNAILLVASGNYPQGAEVAQSAASILDRFTGISTHPELFIYWGLAVATAAVGDVAVASSYMQKGVAILDKLPKDQEDYCGGSRAFYARLLAAKGDRVAACANFKKAHVIFIKHFGEDHPNVKSLRASMQVAGCIQ